MSKKKTFWPYGILLSLFAIVLACIATIIFASDYPVHEDDFYFEKYQSVKDNFSQIEEKQKIFDENFAILLKDELKKELVNKKRKQEAYVVENERLQILIVEQDKQRFKAKDLNITVKLTRPHTSKEDKFFEFFEEQNASSALLSDTKSNTRLINLDLSGLNKGRYQVKIKAQNEQIIGFKNFELILP
ncbi:hypothetical protein DMB92_05110 [Campylobacter sp. MIT 99-7217]|uniref:hypothetical protein n=1 Tax=Campylobacter sp. MIT 99-7217 TaxID=535091 RepID=UPI001159E909|nr:hypothetical protein [Campylobacter sp. MIT 99-7217]TQR32477.1 hypothetical protein DMB92_05110 [Campylobacter sp. MIT 99-7217]